MPRFVPGARPLLILLFLAVAPPGSLRAQENTLAELVADGDAAFAALDNAEAVRLFEAAREQMGEPVSFDLLARLSRSRNDYGMDLVAEGQKERGEFELNRALEYAQVLTDRYPDEAVSWFMLAAAYGNLALFKGGRAKVRIGRAVEEYCKKAIELDPGFAPPYAVLGIFYRELAELNWVQRTLAKALFGGLPAGSYESSADMLRKAIELYPEMPLSHFELGRTLYRGDRREEARPYLETAVALDPMSTLDVRNAVEARRMLDER